MGNSIGCGEDEARPHEKAPLRTSPDIPVAPVIQGSGTTSRAAGLPTFPRVPTRDPRYTTDAEAKRLLGQMPRVDHVRPTSDPPKTADQLARYVKNGGIDKSNFFHYYSQLSTGQQAEYVKKYRNLLHRSKKTRGGRRSRKRRGVRRRKTRHRPAKRRARTKRQHRKKRRSRRRR